MTVESTTRRNDYTGNGATATYNFSFRIFAATDLLVTTKDTLGVQTTLAYPTDYSVTGIGLYSGGSITLTAGNLANNYKITIRRKVPLTQLSSIRNQGGYFPDVVENALDRLDMIALAHQDEIDRAIKLPETEAATNSLYLPTLENRASKFLAFDAAGNIIPAAGTSANLGPVSGYINTLLDDVDASAAQTTLGISTFVKTLLPAVDASAARATLVALSSAAGAVATANLADGSVTLAKKAPYRGAFLYLSTSFAVPSSSLTLVPWNAESVDTDAIHDLVTNPSRLTVPNGVTSVRIRGQLAITVSGALSGDATHAYLYKNGSPSYIGAVGAHSEVVSSVSPYVMPFISPPLAVVGGDYFDVHISQTTSSSASLLGSDSINYTHSWIEMEILA